MRLFINKLMRHYLSPWDVGAAWCIEGPKAKNELRPFIYI